MQDTTSQQGHLARKGQLSARTTVVSLVVVVATTVVVFGAAIVWLLCVSEPREWLPPVMVAAMWLQALIITALLVVVLRRHGVSLSDIGICHPSLRLLHLLWQIPAILVVLLVVQGIVVTFIAIISSSGMESSPDTDSTFSVTGAAPVILVAAALVAGILGPLWEEIFFRGVLFGFLRHRVGAFTAVVASAGVFALIHIDPIMFAYLFTFGIALGLLRIFHRNLWGPLLLHVVINNLVTIVSATAV